jgi:hypothetical protein
VGGGTTQAIGGLLRGQATSRCGMNQQPASRFQRKEAASRQHQLLLSCVKLKNLCQNGKFKTTKHTTIMEQLRIKQINLENKEDYRTRTYRRSSVR